MANLFPLRHISLVSLIFLLVCSCVCAQTTNKVTFDHLTVEEGLSQSTVFSITKDADGYLWFGTRDGLNRYDSRTIKVYRKSDHQNSILGNAIHAFLVDGDKKLWIGTNEGINIYRAETDDFLRSKPHGEGEDKTFFNYVTSIVQDKNGQIWIGTHGGLCKVTSTNPLLYQHFSHNPSDERSLLHNQVRTIYIDRAGDLWIGSTAGLSKIIEGPNGRYSFRNFPIELNHDKGWINCLAEDNSGNIIIGTEQNGIKILNKISGTVTDNLPNGAGRSIESVRVMTRKDDDLWIGTIEGLHIYNYTTRRLRILKNNPEENSSLSDNSVRSIYFDNAGSCWVGTFYGGVNHYSPLSRQFGSINLRNHEHQKAYKIASAMLTDHQENLWIGSDGNGLYCLNRKGETIKQLRHHVNDANSLSNNKVKCLLLDDDKGLWIGTLRGLNYYHFKSETFTHYYNIPNNSHSLPDDRIYDIKKDHEGNLWIGTYWGGLCRFDTRSRTFQRFADTGDSNNSINGNSITYLYEDSHQNLWIGTGTGLHKKTKGKDVFEKVGQSQLYVLCIYEDSKHHLWIGTRNSGLNVMLPGKTTLQELNTEDGLPANTVNGILEDSKGFLWISTNNGLSKVDPRQMTFKNYNRSDGLVCKEFNSNSSYKDPQGYMYFGGYNGIVKFHPDSIQENNSTPLLKFTKLKLFNKEVNIDEHGKGLLDKSISHTSKITFPHDQNVFTLEFACLNYINSSKNKYAYKLDGFESEWNLVNEPVATYMNLSPGEYTLLVKASNNDGLWNPDATSLQINVLPPPWKTWWAYSVYCGVIITLIFWLMRFNKMRWKLQHELELEHMEKEQQEKLHMAKLNFFTNIAHEIRTPLTLIVSPVESASAAYPDDQYLQKHLKTVKGNISRLMRLINQLLDFQKQEYGSLKLKLTEGDLVTCLTEIISSFSDYAHARAIRLELHVIQAEVRSLYDRDELEKVFCNLIYNALKFTPGGGTVCVRLNLEGTVARIVVEDNGIGIPAAELPKIFDRFYQVENTGKGDSGFGIGLALTKGVIDLHGGTIEVESQEAGEDHTGFTKFTISLPCCKSSSASDNASMTNEECIHQNPVQPLDESIRIDESKPYILLVEDNVEIRECVKDILSETYNIIEAGNGTDAIEIIRGELPDLVISDIAMKGMDGLDFTRWIKNDPRTDHIPVILLTARGATEHQIEGMNTGADDYVIKPFHNEVLKLKINNLLATRQRMRKKYNKIVTLEPRKEELEDPDSKFLNRLASILDKNLNDADFNVAKLVTEIGMSRPVLFRKIKTLTGQSVIDLIRTTRLKKAEMLLKQKKMSISEVAFTVGFNDAKYFSKSFRVQFGKTPSEYMDSIE